MIVFKPRKRIALEVNTIEDAEVRGVVEKLALLQQETNKMNNGLDAQIQVAKQELQEMINKMDGANQNLNTLLESIKSQVAVLVDAAVKYQQVAQTGFEEGPKFKASFIYLMRDAVNNLAQVVEGLKNQNGVVVSEPQQTTEEFKVSPTEESVNSPEMTPEPSSVVKTSSAKEILESYKSSIRIANVYQDIMQSIEKLNPIVDSAKNVTNKNNDLMGELQEVMGAVVEKASPELEETEAFSPEGGMELEEPAAEGGLEAPEEEGGITEGEIEEAMDVEEEIGGEAAEEGGEPADEEGGEAAEEGGEPAPEEEGGEPAEEGGEAADEEIEEIVEEDEGTAAEEPAEKTEE
jgi:uncharacterized protein YukE